MFYLIAAHWCQKYMNYLLHLRCCSLPPCSHDRPGEATLNGNCVAPLDGDGDGRALGRL